MDSKNNLKHPKYWPLWLLLGIFRLIVLLPYRWQLTVGRGLGLLGFVFAARRRHISSVNLKLCFPALSARAHAKLLRKSFESIGMGFMEALMAWFMSERRFQKIPFVWLGQEHYEAAHSSAGVILLTGHFNCLEVIGRAVSKYMTFGVVYKRSHSAFFENLLMLGRARYTQNAIRHSQLKTMVNYLKKDKASLWYLPDQDFGRDRSVFSPWFGVATATLVGTSVLAKLGQAHVVPAYFRRLPRGKGYELITLPAMENFPSEDNQADADRWQKLLEDFVRKYPEDYLWLHRRFKTRPAGEPSVY